MVESFLFLFLRIEVHSHEKADRAGTFGRVGAARVGFLGYRIERWVMSAGEWLAKVYEDKNRYIFGAIVTRKIAGIAGAWNSVGGGRGKPGDEGIIIVRGIVRAGIYATTGGRDMGGGDEPVVWKMQGRLNEAARAADAARVV
jgi:hypothetical protein